MKQRIYIPQYDLEGATKASTLLRTAAEDAQSTISGFGGEYGAIARGAGTALKLLARFTPDLVAKGVGLDCELYIGRQGRIEITGYRSGEEWIGRGQLACVQNIGPYSSGVSGYDHYSACYSLCDMFGGIERLLDSPSEADIGKPCMDERCCPGGADRYKKDLELFDSYLRRGKTLKVVSL